MIVLLVLVSYQVAIDGKRALTIEKHPLVAELKWRHKKKHSICDFSISALPPEDNFQMSTHFQHLWPLAQKSYVQVFFKDGGLFTGTCLMVNIHIHWMIFYSRWTYTKDLQVRVHFIRLLWYLPDPDLHIQTEQRSQFNDYRPRSEGDNALGSVRLFVCLSVRLSVLSCLNRSTYDLDIWYYQSKVFVCVSIISRRMRIIARKRSIGF